MKKILLAISAIAVLAACTKSEVEFTQADEIGFIPVARMNTKAAVINNEYPTGLDIFVFAQTDETSVTTANYLNNARFGFSQAATNSAGTSTENGTTVNLWAGDPNPYYWPNEKKLFFAGVSESGNINATGGVTPTYANGSITVDGYVATPGTVALGDNDLMWFPKTSESYGKGTKYVPVTMKHACSWITIKLVGDSVTGGNYTVTDIKISGLTTKGNVTLGTDASWTLSTEAGYTAQEFDVFTPETGTIGKALPKETATEDGFETIKNNTIVLPNQVPGTLSITYQFTTQAGNTLTETVTGSLKYDNDKQWVAGTHYTYTVTIGAEQILIDPTVTVWTPSPSEGGHTVTVQ